MCLLSRYAFAAAVAAAVVLLRGTEVFGALHAYELVYSYWKMTWRELFFFEVVFFRVSAFYSCFECSLSDGSIWSSPDFALGLQDLWADARFIYVDAFFLCSFVIMLVFRGFIN